MARFGIVPLPECGHINATVRLATELRAAGHAVTYYATEDCAALFAGLSVPVEVLPAEWVPSGHMVPAFGKAAERPDFLLVDSIMPPIAIWAWKNGMRVVNVSTTFSLRYDPRVPPLNVDLIPAEPEANAIAAGWRAEWARLGTRSAGAPSLLDRYRDFASQCGYPLNSLDERAAFVPQADFPELVLAPQELDFPRSGADVTYAGACVELSRAEPPLVLGESHSGRPLIYCSFGSQVQRYAALRERLDVVTGAARLLPELHFIVASPETGADTSAPNLTRLARAPQLALLRRAALMVSHAGLNGVKEALTLGVPLVVLPFDQDQPGNAARVAHHGFGLKADWDSLDAGELARLIVRALNDARIRRRVLELSERLQSALRSSHAASSLERLLLPRNPGAAANLNPGAIA